MAISFRIRPSAVWCVRLRSVSKGVFRYIMACGTIMSMVRRLAVTRLFMRRCAVSRLHKRIVPSARRNICYYQKFCYNLNLLTHKAALYFKFAKRFADLGGDGSVITPSYVETEEYPSG